MGFGNSGKKATKKANEALKPYAFSDVLGGTRVRGQNIQYLPKAGQEVATDLKSARSLGRIGLNQYQNLLQNNTPEAQFNNPFYTGTVDLFRQPINNQYMRDEYDLTNNLNARNQMGSSYDALMRGNLMRQRNSELNQAELAARQWAQQAYLGQFDQAAKGLGLSNDFQTSAINNLYAPLNYYVEYQRALSNNQQARAQNYQAQAQREAQQRQQMMQDATAAALAAANPAAAAAYYGATRAGG